MGFLNTVVSWFVWLFVTFVRQLGSGSLKARLLVITFAHAQRFGAWSKFRFIVERSSKWRWFRFATVL